MYPETIKYTGCFLGPELLQKCLKGYSRQTLSRKIANPHVTFAYHPETVPSELFGQTVTVRAIGYGCDGENEALLVEFDDLPEPLRLYAEAIAVPHITLSISESGKAVNSRMLNFNPITPFVLDGVFGGMDEAGTVHTEAFL